MYYKLLKTTKPLLLRFPLLVMVYRFLQFNRFFFKFMKKTPMGFNFIGFRNMQDCSYEADEVKIATNCLEETDVFINIGANIGYYCCIALMRGKHTIAFEPIDANLRYLYKNIIANNFKNIEVFPIALTNRIGLLEIYGGGARASLVKGWADTPEQCKRFVPVSTIDNILQNRLIGKKCFIVVDIEGAEYEMLNGAKTLLNSEPKPIWMIEIFVTREQPKGVNINPHLLPTFQKFWENGYDAWTASKYPVRVNKEEINKICKTGENTLKTSNFIFVESGKNYP